MVSLSRLFHKTEELDTKTAAVPTSAAPACAQTAEAKTASVELPQEFLDKFPGGMFRYKAESAGVIDRASSGLVRLFGCSDAEQFRALTGNTFKGIVHPDDREWVSASISEQMEHGDSDYVRYRIIRADGEVRWVDDWGHLVEDASGARWFYATLMDATERVREKEELRRRTSGWRSSRRSRTTCSSISSAVRARPMCTAISRAVSAGLPSRRILW